MRKELGFLIIVASLASISLTTLAAFAGYYAVLDDNMHKTWR